MVLVAKRERLLLGFVVTLCLLPAPLALPAMPEMSKMARAAIFRGHFACAGSPKDQPFARRSWAEGEMGSIANSRQWILDKLPAIFCISELMRPD